MASSTSALGGSTARSGIAAPGSFSINNTRSWYDIIEEQEQEQEARVLQMSDVDWRAEGLNLIWSWQGRDISTCIAYLERMDSLRAAAAAPSRPTILPCTTSNADFDLWKDMVEEPWKYGDDIDDWVELDTRLRQKPGRWRIEAYWNRLQAIEDAQEEALAAPWRARYSQIAKEAAYAGERRWIQRDIRRIVARVRNAAIAIQAAVRGHLVRNGLPFRDCCMCLSHRICPLQTSVGMMCRACAQQGPYVDILGPLADEWNWHRADYTDLTRRN